MAARARGGTGCPRKVSCVLMLWRCAACATEIGSASMALIPVGERPTETGAKSAVKIGRRELAIRIRGVRAFVAGETPGGHEWNQQNLKNGFLDVPR